LLITQQPEERSSEIRLSLGSDAVTSFPIQIFIGAQRARGVHIMVLAICTLVMFIDGLEILMGCERPVHRDPFHPCQRLTLS